MVHLSFRNLTFQSPTSFPPLFHPSPFIPHITSPKNLPPPHHPNPFPSPLPLHPSPFTPPSPLLLPPLPLHSSPSAPLPSPLQLPLRSTACQWTTVEFTPAACLVCSRPIPCVGGARPRDAACQQMAAAWPTRLPVTTMLPAVQQLPMYHHGKLILSTMKL